MVFLSHTLNTSPIVVELLHLPHCLLQPSRHEVGPGGRAVVALQVLQEAEEQRVHGHLVHAEEAAGDEVRADHDDDDRGLEDKGDVSFGYT